MKTEITLGKTYYSIKSDDTESLLKKLSSFLDSLKKYRFEYSRRFRKLYSVLDRVYYLQDPRDNTFYFPITTVGDGLSGFMDYINGPGREHVYFTPDYNIYSFKANMKDHLKLRDYQEEYVNIITKQGRYLVDLKPGSGKTFIAVNAMVRLGMRTGIVVLPKYMDKWREDIKNYTDITDEDIYTVQGSESLYSLLEEKGGKYKVIIFSLRTLYLFYSKYESGDDIGVKPWEVFNTLRIGMLLNDESHQELDALFKVVMYSNVIKIIGLSATFLPNNRSEDRIQNILFPQDSRVSNLVKNKPYIDIYAVGYEIPKIVKLRDSGGQGYNHLLFEQSLMKNETLFNNYLEMVENYIQEGYILKKEDGEKCLIFFSTIEACNRAVDYIKSKFPNYQITRNIGDDDYHEMLKGDIIVTTPGSSGTAIDFPNLICVINTVSIGSTKSNIQIVGRLRYIKNRPQTYYYFFCRGNKKQRNLHKRRKEAISHMAKSYKVIDYMKAIIPYKLQYPEYKFN